MIAGSRVISQMDPITSDQRRWVSDNYHRAMGYAKCLARRYPYVCPHDIDSDMHTALIYGVYSARRTHGEGVYWIAVKRKAQSLVRQRASNLMRDCSMDLLLELVDDRRKRLPPQLHANILGEWANPVATPRGTHDQNKKRYRRNKEKENARQRAYRAANRERVRAQQRERYHSKKEEISARRKQKYANADSGIAEKRKEYARKYRAEHAEELRRKKRELYWRKKQEQKKCQTATSNQCQPPTSTETDGTVSSGAARKHPEHRSRPPRSCAASAAGCPC